MFIPVLAFSQKVRVHIVEGDTNVYYNDYIKGHSNRELIGQLNSYPYRRLMEVMFYSEPSAALVDKLRLNRVRVVDRFSDPVYLHQAESQPEFTLNLPDEEALRENEDRQLISALEGKHGAMAFEVIGIGLISTALVHQFDKYKSAVPSVSELQKRENQVKTLAIIGGASFLVGWTINISSDRAIIDVLKKRSK